MINNQQNNGQKETGKITQKTTNLRTAIKMNFKLQTLKNENSQNMTCKIPPILVERDGLISFLEQSKILISSQLNLQSSVIHKFASSRLLVSHYLNIHNVSLWFKNVSLFQLALGSLC